jgi:hypothetical protein
MQGGGWAGPRPHVLEQALHGVLAVAQLRPDQVPGHRGLAQGRAERGEGRSVGRRRLGPRGAGGLAIGLGDKPALLRHSKATRQPNGERRRCAGTPMPALLYAANPSRHSFPPPLAPHPLTSLASLLSGSTSSRTTFSRSWLLRGVGGLWGRRGWCGQWGCVVACTGGWGRDGLSCASLRWWRDSGGVGVTPVGEETSSAASLQRLTPWGPRPLAPSPTHNILTC